MDYEKKYNEALERARGLLEIVKEDKVEITEEDVKSLFHELRESEEEGIRKEIINFLRSPFVTENITDEKIAPWVTYLEKQKEQKPVEWNPNYEDVILFNKAVTTNQNLTPSERAKLDIIRTKFKHCNGHIATSDFDLALGERYIQGYNDALEELKPAWSEEDEEMVKEIKHIVFGAGSVRNGMREKIHDWLYNRLKSLRPQPHTVSMKDATKFGNLEYERGVKDGIQHSENHRWKPSEEQMEALHTAVYLEEMQFYGGLKDKLRVLYEQLKGIY